MGASLIMHYLWLVTAWPWMTTAICILRIRAITAFTRFLPKESLLPLRVTVRWLTPVMAGQLLRQALVQPVSVVVNRTGNLFIAESSNRVRKVSVNGIVTTVAGNGTQGFSGDGGPATSAQLFFPRAVVVDANGNLFGSDAINGRVRKVSTDGINLDGRWQRSPGVL